MDTADRALKARQVRLQMLGRVGLSNLVGALLVFTYFWVLPTDAGDWAGRVSDDDVVSAVTFLVLLAVFMPTGFLMGSRHFRPVEQWLAEGRSPTAVERAAALSQPARQAAVSLVLWTVGAVIFASLNAGFDAPKRVVLRVLFGSILGGLTTSAACFLLVERFLRPVFADALAGEVPARATALGVRPRLVLSWALGSAVPLLGIISVPLAPGLDVDQLRLPMVFLAAVGLVAGGVLIVIAAKSVAEPVECVRRAMGSVQRGDLGARLRVDDGGEIGMLQAGFNQMADGLREREQLRDLFGRYVGEEVARRAIGRAAGLGGEQREASVLFVDLVGSTALAQKLGPNEVVDRLNDFFGAVVRVTAAEGGWVNKFEGDGALCVFGAPAEQPDHAARALRAAHALAAALRDLSLEAGIGVSSGTVVAGNVGAEQRFEYTVIGDPVNEAARLTEAAKAHPARVLASQATVRAAGAEAASWVEVGPLELRGRAQPTIAYAPAQSGAEASALQARATPSSSTS